MHEVEIDRYEWWCRACCFGDAFDTMVEASIHGQAHAARHEPMLPVVWIGGEPE